MQSRYLVAGWFSFEHGHATAGDLLARDLTCEWLTQAGCKYDVALCAPFSGGVDVLTVDENLYTHLVMVCGPFEKGELERILLRKFWRSRLIGLNLSMREPLERWAPFDFLIERDSSLRVRPDFVFGTKQPLVPVTGVCLVEDYPQGQTGTANAAIRRLLDSVEAAVLQIDTRLDANSTGLRSAAEIETVIARLDVIVTTRLHGMVLALKNGVPALVIDPEAGGAKIRKQAAVLQWPVVFDVAHVQQEALRGAFAFCLTAEARAQARQCGVRAAEMVRESGAEFLDSLTRSELLEVPYRRRLAEHAAFVDWDAGTPQVKTTFIERAVARSMHSARSRWHKLRGRAD